MYAFIVKHLRLRNTQEESPTIQNAATPRPRELAPPDTSIKEAIDQRLAHCLLVVITRCTPYSADNSLLRTFSAGKIMLAGVPSRHVDQTLRLLATNTSSIPSVSAETAFGELALISTVNNWISTSLLKNSNEENFYCWLFEWLFGVIPATYVEWRTEIEKDELSALCSGEHRFLELKSRYNQHRRCIARQVRNLDRPANFGQ